MKLICVSGTRGSGKTSVVRELVARLGSEGLRSAVIVNEEGRVPYDKGFVREHGVTVKSIRGG
jgi:G3E family GTPase